MPVSFALPGFVAGAVVSLLTSFVLVMRLERVGERLGLSEALLGMVAALAADAPEVTAAVTAVAHHEHRVGAGVVIGSNVFNLAALLGLGAVVAGRIGLHRKVVVVGGAVAIWVAAVCLAVVAGVIPAAAGVVLALVVVALYLLVLGHDWRDLGRLPLPQRWTEWLRSAVSEEELELEAAIRPRRGRWPDVVIAGAALLVVVVASVTMERSASVLGSRYAIPEIVIGGLVLAAVTSLPNAVAAVYLAARGRGAATLSTALNSNTLNIVAGLLLPAAATGLGKPSPQTLLITVWNVAMTVLVLASAYRNRGLRRPVGILVIAVYVGFAAVVLMSGYAVSADPRLLAAAGVAGAVAAGWLVFGRTPGQGPGGSARQAGSDRAAAGLLPGGSPAVSGNGSGRPQGGEFAALHHQAGSQMRRESLIPGWSVRKLSILALVLSLLVAAADAALSSHAVLIGLLIIGPCCALLTGGWVPTGLAGLWATGLAVLLGYPDHIWGTATHLAFLGAVAVVSLTSTLAAVLISNPRPGRRDRGPVP